MTNDPWQRLFDAIDPVKGMSDTEIDALIPTEGLAQRVQNREARKPADSSRWRSTRRVAIVATIVVLIVAGIVTGAIVRAPSPKASLVECYSRDSPTSSVTAAVPYTRHSMASCQTQSRWRLGPRGHASSGILCVLSNGTLGAFPAPTGTTSCAKMGLASFNSLKNPQVFRFEKYAHRYFVNNPCVPPTDARRQILELIGRFGLVGWHVFLNSTAPSRGCAIVAVESRSQVISITAASR